MSEIWGACQHCEEPSYAGAVVETKVQYNKDWWKCPKCFEFNDTQATRNNHIKEDTMNNHHREYLRADREETEDGLEGGDFRKRRAELSKANAEQVGIIPEGTFKFPEVPKQVGGSHYQLAIQPIDYILENKLGYCEGNVIKYVSRHADKNGAEDIKKAIHYLEFILKDQYDA